MVVVGGGGSGGFCCVVSNSTCSDLTYSRRKARSVWEPTLQVVNVFITFTLIPEVKTGNICVFRGLLLGFADREIVHMHNFLQ